MADVTVLTDMWKEEEKRIKELLEKLGQQMKDHGVGRSKVKVEGVNCNKLLEKLHRQQMKDPLLSYRAVSIKEKVEKNIYKWDTI